MDKMLNNLKLAVFAALTMGLALGAGAAGIEYVAPVYVDGVASNGIAYWTTNTVSTYTVVESSASAMTWGESGATNWFVVKDADVQIDGSVTCAVHVNLILCEGAKLVVTNVANDKAGIATDASGSFTVYGQPDGAGVLYSYGGYSGAGIGGGQYADGAAITIANATVFVCGAAQHSADGCLSPDCIGNGADSSGVASAVAIAPSAMAIPRGLPAGCAGFSLQTGSLRLRLDRRR